MAYVSPRHNIPLLVVAAVVAVDKGNQPLKAEIAHLHFTEALELGVVALTASPEIPGCVIPISS